MSSICLPTARVDLPRLNVLILVWIGGTHSDPISLDALVEHHAHSLADLLLALLLGALGDLSGDIESLVPWIEKQINVAQLTGTGDGGGPDFFHDLGMAEIIYAVL